MVLDVLSFFLVGAGGLCGSMLRFGVTTLVDLLPFDTSLYPVHTFIVNITGSFIIGLLVNKNGSRWYHFASTGFCGGLTTFSTFALEVAKMSAKKNFINAAAYTVATVCCCISCAYISYWIAAIRPMRKALSTAGLLDSLKNDDAARVG
jgi:CrcB protein